MRGVLVVRGEDRPPRVAIVETRAESPGSAPERPVRTHPRAERALSGRVIPVPIVGVWLCQARTHTQNSPSMRTRAESPGSAPVRPVRAHPRPSAPSQGA